MSLPKHGVTATPKVEVATAGKQAPGHDHDAAMLQLEPGEQILAAGDAVLRAGLYARLVFGLLWNRYHRVRLVLTDRRLIELVRPFGGRAPGSRVRTWRWDTIVSVNIEGHTLALSPYPGRRVSWRLLHGHESPAISSALVQLRTIPAAPHNHDAMIGSPSQCPECTAALPDQPARCPNCGLGFVSPRAASWLALAIPGGGHLATGHLVVAAGRAVFEIAVLLMLWTEFVGNRLMFEFPPLILAPVGGLIAIKVEAAMTARAFARLLVPWSHRARRLWLGIAVITAAASVSVAVHFASVAWSIGRAGLRDIEFHKADLLGWEAQYLPAAERNLSSPALRSTWNHEDLWVAQVRAEALPPGQSFDQWIAEHNAQRQERGLQPGEPVHLGVVHGVAFTTPDQESGNEIMRLEFAIENSDYHAVHTVRCDVFANQTSDARALLEDLLRRAHWIQADGPCNPQWRSAG